MAQHVRFVAANISISNKRLAAVGIIVAVTHSVSLYVAFTQTDRPAVPVDLSSNRRYWSLLDLLCNSHS